MIIDCHCHAGKGDGLTGPWDTAADLDKYLRRAAQAGIDRTVLFAAFHSDYAVANREVARIVAAHPRQFYGFAFVHPARDRGRVEAVVREAVVGHGFCGIKVHRYDAPITREICETARRFRVPILYDVMGDIAVVDLLATGTRISRSSFHIWAASPTRSKHSGRSSIRWSASRTCSPIRQACAGSICSKRPSPVRARPRSSSGSDGPWLHPGVEFAKVLALGLSRWDESAVLAGNCLRLIRRTRRPGSRPVEGNGMSIIRVTARLSCRARGVTCQPVRRARQAAIGGVDRHADRQVLGGPPDALQADARGDRRSDRAFESLVPPVAKAARCGPLEVRDVAHRDRTTPHVAQEDARQQLPEVADVAWVFARQQVPPEPVLPTRGAARRA